MSFVADFVLPFQAQQSLLQQSWPSSIRYSDDWEGHNELSDQVSAGQAQQEKQQQQQQLHGAGSLGGRAPSLGTFGGGRVSIEHAGAQGWLDHHAMGVDSGRNRGIGEVMPPIVIGSEAAAAGEEERGRGHNHRSAELQQQQPGLEDSGNRRELQLISQNAGDGTAVYSINRDGSMAASAPKVLSSASKGHLPVSATSSNQSQNRHSYEAQSIRPVLTRAATREGFWSSAGSNARGIGGGDGAGGSGRISKRQQLAPVRLSGDKGQQQEEVMFKGLRVRMGVATGYVAKGLKIKNSEVYQRAQSECLGEGEQGRVLWWMAYSWFLTS